MQLPPEAWPDLLTIDGAECRGCFQQLEQRRYDDRGELRISAICWIEIPTCTCPPCRIYCGSEIAYNNKTYTADEAGVASSTDCIKWYLNEQCSPC